MTPARRIGPFLAAVLVAGNMIGSGIYLLPASLAAIGSAGIIGWAIAAAGALLLAGVFAILAVVRPSADGIVAYPGEGLHPAFGFMSWLAYWVSCWVGNVGLAVAAVGYLAVFLPGVIGPLPSLAAILAITWLLAGLNLIGPRLIGRLAALTLLVGLAPIVAATALGFISFDPHVFAASWNVSGKPLSQAVPASLVIVFWAFLGLESATVAAAVVDNPRRNVPIAALGGVALASVVYAAATVAIMGIMPAAALAHSTAPFAEVVARVAGPLAGAVIAACALLKTLGTLGGWMLLTAESGRSGAAAGFLPRAMSEVSPERTPTRDVLVTAILMSLVALATLSPTLNKQFNAIINVAVVLEMAVYILCALALVRFAEAIGNIARRRLAQAAALVAVAFCVWVVAAGDRSLTLPAVVFLSAALPIFGLVLLYRRSQPRSKVTP